MKSKGDTNKPIYDKTIDYIIFLRDEPTVKQSEYHRILVLLCEKILHEDVNKIETVIENAEQSKQKCSACGGILETWEREICGPCKIKDPKFEEELDE
jgi:recombinational DNA repair protein RecR